MRKFVFVFSLAMCLCLPSLAFSDLTSEIEDKMVDLCVYKYSGPDIDACMELQIQAFNDLLAFIHASGESNKKVLKYCMKKHLVEEVEAPNWPPTTICYVEAVTETGF